MEKYKLLVFAIKILFLNISLSAMDTENSIEPVIGKKYLVITDFIKNKNDVKLLKIIDLTFELYKNPNIHPIVMNRVKNHKNKENLVKLITDLKLENYNQLPEEIKKPVYLVQLVNYSNTGYVEKEWLKEINN